MNRQRLLERDTPSSISPERAAELMRAGLPVIFPTETFFALGSRCFDPDASARVFLAKHRSTVRPLPLILGDRAQLDAVAKMPETLSSLLDTFWPGPLSVLLPARLRVPEVLTGGTGRVAVRLSPHPAARALALAVGEPITASSANISGATPVTRAADLDPELRAAAAGVLDLPPVPLGGLPSTLVEPEGKALRVLRQGAISCEELRRKGFIVLED